MTSTSRRRSILHGTRAAAAGAALLAIGCNPYTYGEDEFYAGTVVPANFPAAYVGAGATPNKGVGTISPVSAYVGGNAVRYYSFPATTAALPTPPPNVYVFDQGGASHCVAPANYQYDFRRDAYRQDEQNSIFTSLPDAKGYIPVVSEVPVTSAGEPCQSIKSEKTLLQRRDVTVPMAGGTGMSDGNLLAWAIIDPSASVLNPDGSMPDTATGLGPQKRGWFNHYLLTYLDGGPIKTKVVPGMMGMPDTTRLVAQKLYYPTQILKMTAGMPPKAAAGMLGAGFDVLQAKRGDANYSPLCRAYTYDPPGATADPKTSMPMPLQDAAAIEAADPMTTNITATTKYFYCLQLQ